MPCCFNNKFYFLQGCGVKPEHFIPDFVEEWFEKDSSIPDLPI